jgi:putative hydrolase of the HAD superfamily
MAPGGREAMPGVPVGEADGETSTGKGKSSLRGWEMSVRAVIFDFAGVLSHTSDPRGRLEWAERLGRSVRELARIVFYSEVAGRVELGQAPTSAIWEHLAHTFDLTDGEVEQFKRDFWSGDRLDPELVAFVRSLRPRCKTAVLSNAWPDTRQAFVEVFGLDQVVDEIIISAEEGVAKPDPRIFRIALDRLGVQPEQAVFVDDTAGHVEAARAVGMRAIQFESTYQVIADILELLQEKGAG